MEGFGKSSIPTNWRARIPNWVRHSAHYDGNTSRDKGQYSRKEMEHSIRKVRIS